MQGYPIYDAKKETLEEYLKHHEGGSCIPLFYGYEHYKMLWEKKLLVPGSGVRITCVGIGVDQSYTVMGELEVKGLDGTFGGKPGTHNPKTLLKEQYWEALGLNRSVLEVKEK
jgi:hypothetical protein